MSKKISLGFVIILESYRLFTAYISRAYRYNYFWFASTILIRLALLSIVTTDLLTI